MKNSILLITISLFFSCNNEIDFEIKNDIDKTIITVLESGSIIIDNKSIGNISKEGSVIDKDGTIVSKIVNDKLVLTAQDFNFINLDKNGRSSGIYGEHDIRWSDKGELMKFNKNTGFTISPVRKEAFRNATILLFLYEKQKNINNDN